MMNAETLKTPLGKRLFSAVMSLFVLAVCVLFALPAAADDPDTTTFTFNKYLVMDVPDAMINETKAPPAAFTFTITPGMEVPGEGILAGVGNPTIGQAVFTSTDTVTRGLPTDSQGTTTSGKAYATKQVTVDFSGITFPALGIYRYTITEDSSPTTDFTVDTTSRTLDVSVGYDDNDALVILGYTLHTGTGATPTDPQQKSNGFTNNFSSHTLKLEKQVTGNQGDRNKYFTFTVAISDAVAGTTYAVDLTHADENPTIGTESKTNAKNLTVENDGSVTATYYLKHNQYIVIYGLTDNTKYTITETKDNGDTYTTSYTIDSDQPVKADDTGLQNMSSANHAVTFTNEKEGNVPTGILLETAPYIVLVAVVAVGLVLLALTSKRRSRTDKNDEQ